jgi:N-acetylmuramoyl-L-alanine amidase
MAKVYLGFLDDGHGIKPPTPGKRTPVVPEYGRQILENEFNRAVVNKMIPLLKRCGITPIPVAPTDKDTPLASRTDYANRVFAQYKSKYGSSNVEAVYISVHYDAISTTWASAEGITIYVYPGHKNKAAGKLANDIGKYLRQGTSQQYRGIKEANFHVLRESAMPAILSENGFMSSRKEAPLMLNSSFQTEVATEHTKGMCDYFGVRYVSTAPAPTPTPAPQKPATGKTMYRVIAGSFTSRKNADEQIAKLKKAGFNAFIDIYKKGSTTYYRVVSGSFSKRDNADDQVALMKKAGFPSFIDIVKI